MSLTIIRVSEHRSDPVRYGSIVVCCTNKGMELLAASLFSLVFLACSAGSPTGDPPAIDAAASTPDALPSPAADASQSTLCEPSEEVEASYTDSGLRSANNPWNEAEGYWEMSANLAGANGPVFHLRLHPGRGQFSDPITPGTYVIGNDDSRLEDCALCAYVTAEGTGGTSYFMGESGTLTLTTIAFGDVVDVIEGELVEGVFQAVDLSGNGASCQPADECENTSCAANGKCLVQEANNTCRTSIGRLQFRTP